MTTRFALLFASCVAMAAWPAGARAAGIVGNGTPASCTEAALTAALAGGGTVTFDCGSGNVTIPLAAEQVITASTTLDGAGRIALSGQDASRHFRVPGAPPPGLALTVRGLTLASGRCPLTAPGTEPGYGGAIVAGAGSQVTLVDVGLSLNTCDAPAAGAGGGAVHVRGGSLTLVGVSGFGNVGSDGAIVNAHESSVTVDDSTFTSNSPTRRGGLVFAQGAGGGRIVVRRSRLPSMSAPAGGGAVYATFGPGDQGLLFEASFVSGSSTTGADGGALYVEGGPIVIDASTFQGNHARRGAAVFAKDAALTVSNSTFASNWAHEATPGDGNGIGGAIFLAGTVTGSISHSTLALNRADGAGGAIGGTGSSPLVLRASLLGGNTSGNPLVFSSCSVVLASGGFNIQQGPGGDLDCAPGILRRSLGIQAFSSAGTGYFPLAPDSPARDLVTSGCPPPAVDQRGLARPTGPRCDAGSFEWAPQITVANAELFEGNSGSAPMTFTIRLSDAWPETVTVAYATGPEGDATPGVDYVAAAGVVTFAPGDTARAVDVLVLGDTVDESSESFAFRLSAPTGAALGTVAADGRIIDDDMPPTISVEGCSSSESAATCPFRVRMNTFSGAPVTVQYATANGTATAGEDFQATSGTLTFLPGTAEAIVDVPIFDDAIDEATESFTFTLSAPQNGTIGAGTMSGVIRDNDGPRISIGDVATVEGFGGQHVVSLSVSLSAPSPERVEVTYSTLAGTALPDLDYAAVGGSLTFQPGEVTSTALAVVLGDTLDEPDERFRVVLLSPQNATVAEGGGIVTIADDDGGAMRVRELAHGVGQRSDLAGSADLHVVHQPPYSSWEVIVDEASGDLGTGAGPQLVRLSPDLTTVLDSSDPVGAGRVRSLRWVHVATDWEREDYVRVASQGCSSDCGPDDTYRIRAYETTLRSTRFNCAGGQRSVLVLQNVGPSLVKIWPQFWTGTGFRIAGAFGYVDPRGVVAVDVCAVDSAMAGQSGSVTVAHEGAYGQLTGKVVAVDPATGAAFDTPLTARPR